MEITPTTAATAAAARRSTEQAGSAGALAADFQTFLTLLTTQMKNQDPLKPMESTEFVAQLATFSGVEQQVRANDRLDAIIEVLGGGAAGLAEWIGREVRAPGKAAFEGEPVEVGFAPVAGADKAWLVVRNDFDQIVARLPVDPAADTVAWDGTDGMGNAASRTAATASRSRASTARRPARHPGRHGLRRRHRGARRRRPAGARARGRQPRDARPGDGGPVTPRRTVAASRPERANQAPRERAGSRVDGLPRRRSSGAGRHSAAPGRRPTHPRPLPLFGSFSAWTGAAVVLHLVRAAILLRPGAVTITNWLIFSTSSCR